MQDQSILKLHIIELYSKMVVAGFVRKYLYLLYTTGSGLASNTKFFRSNARLAIESTFLEVTWIMCTKFFFYKG